MIKTHARDTGLKNEFRKATKMATRRLRIALFISIVFNIILAISLRYS